MVLLKKYFLLLTVLLVVCFSIGPSLLYAQTCDETTPNDGLCLRDGTEPGYSAAELTSWLETLDTADRAATTTLRGRVILSTSGESTAGEVVEATDSRLSNARTPSGSAAGDLTGTYPNPTIGADKVLESHLKVVDTAADEECLTRETTAPGDFEWQPCASAGGYATIQDETTPLITQTVVNFTGAGVTCVNNAGATRTDCTIAGGGGGSGDVEAFGGCPSGQCGVAGGTDFIPGLIHEGTADNFELDWQVTNPTADRTQTYPDASGTYVLKDGNNDLVGTIRDIDLRKILPTVGTTQFLQAGTSIDCSTGFWVQVCGSTDGVACSAAVDLTVNPQIVAGTKDGQICILLGADTTNTVTLDTGTGLRLRNQRVLGADGDGFLEAVWLRWTGTLWEEVMPLGALDNTDTQSLNSAASFGKLIDTAVSLGSAVKIGMSATQAIAIYHDATRGPVVEGICSGVPCDILEGPQVGKIWGIGDTAGNIGIKAPESEVTALDWLERGSDAATPATGRWKLYFKSGGLFLRDDAGVVTGPLGTGGGGGGDFSSNTATSVDNEIVLFSGTAGKTGKRATTTGILKGTSGVLSAATAGTDYVTPSSTESLTNKSLNVEGTGNAITTVAKIWMEAAACAGTTGTLMWDTLAANAPTASCSAGTTETTLMRGLADFPDSDGDISLQRAFMIPSDWTGTIDLKFVWRAAATGAVDVVWQAALACRAAGEVDDVAFNTLSTVTDTTQGTTNQLNTATITGLTTTGCAAGELAHLKVLRNRTHASDSITGVISLVGVEVTARRAQ